MDMPNGKNTNQPGSPIAGSDPACCCGLSSDPFPIYQKPPKEEPCCGPPPGPASSPHERPGYILWHFVEEFIRTPAGDVPRIKTRLDPRDHAGTLRVRLGFDRNAYKVAPGLYAAGRPDAAAPVLVTANYKLSFDHLRSHLGSLNAWILVLDTRGINVWCAAGKGTFGTAELIERVRKTGLAEVVSHRRLILPQLGATGVAAHEVKKACGFEVVWGPVAARDIPAFVAAGLKAEPRMRRVTFSLAERLILVPVEITLLRKYFLWSLLILFLLSGVGGHIFSFSAALHRGVLAVSACLAGIAAGCILTPALLPWLPGRAFALKGALTGVTAGIATVAWIGSGQGSSVWSAAGLVLMAAAVSSYLAMNFTGSTPFTSPSGVEKEMRRYIPLQAGAVLLSAGIWVAAGF